MNKSVDIVEVGPRDGLQNEQVPFSTKNKLDLIGQAVAAGARRIEVTSFVHPKIVPQMADAENLVASLPENSAVTYIGLVLNGHGLERALATRAGGRGIDEIGCVAVVTDTFADRNQGQTSQESIDISKEIIRRAKTDGLLAQVTLSAAFGCPFEGVIDPARVIDIVKSLAEAGPFEIAIADTIGVAVPSQVRDLFGALQDALPEMKFRGHFHNTRNTGIANAWAAYEAGVRTFDSSLAGLGGCPFAPKATGNIATEDLVYMFERSGVKTGLDLKALIGSA
ncbi:MAG: hydroxymethylglutaryl-CoA lyase, partial [Sphingomonadales bacterium]